MRWRNRPRRAAVKSPFAPRETPLFVLVDIIDNGPGIPPEVKSRIFDPFFTTKPVGEGTGLGLDTVYRIVRQHEGDVRVDSRPGETHFQVRLPIPQGA